jgi:hypothetical protein
VGEESGLLEESLVRPQRTEPKPSKTAESGRLRLGDFIVAGDCEESVNNTDNHMPSPSSIKVMH